ncbi:hypothetical protein GSI_04335 [Ganoderma sinense ZZ0214-1]|uniref:EF-hand domain-containing protein n=1 Tax=Ganoderma sinense ZZ0214-1 TaxID=1077348 RepID=A0A2G8SIZ3_9APHY|nr:hypothetical protein GSI_04335 [Ganoderma sinense ZZ0214-1]
MDVYSNDRDTAKPKDTAVDTDTVAGLTVAPRGTVAAAPDLAASRLRPVALLREQIPSCGTGSKPSIRTDQGTSPCMSFLTRCLGIAEKALINGDWTPFDLDTVKLLMSIFRDVQDTDRSGTIGFNEFSGLWKYIKDWQNVFRHFDRDRSGSIDGGELQQALHQFGYNLSPALLRLVELKYDIHQGSGPSVGHGMPPQAQGGITFDRFVRACVVIKQITESFQRLDTNRSGWIQINYDQFMHTVLSLP